MATYNFNRFQTYTGVGVGTPQNDTVHIFGVYNQFNIPPAGFNSANSLVQNTTTRLGAGDDVLRLSHRSFINNSFNTESGNDIIRIRMQDFGSSTLNAVFSDNSIYAGSGNDRIWAVAEGTSVLSNSLVNAGHGDDVVVAQNLSGGSIVGGEGNDRIHVSTSEDLVVKAGAGNDRITIDATTTGQVWGGQGNDTLQIEMGNRALGDLTVSGGSGNDTITYQNTAITESMEWGTLSGPVSLTGGSGNDAITVDLDFNVDSNFIGQSSGIVNESIYTPFSGDLYGATIEVEAYLEGGSGDDTLFFSAEHDTVRDQITDVEQVAVYEPYYEYRDIYESQPVYELRDIYESQPVYELRDIYETQPVYELTYIHHTDPIYEDIEIIEEDGNAYTGSVLVGYEDFYEEVEVFVGYEDVYVGQEEVFVGYEDVYVGQEEVFVGYEDVYVGQEEVYVGEQFVGYENQYYSYETDVTPYVDASGSSLVGGSGNDTLTVEYGNGVYLDGGSGNDTLKSQNSGVLMFGGAGDDMNLGGTGNDTFIFSVNDGDDIVQDTQGYNAVRFVGSIQQDNVALWRDASTNQTWFQYDDTSTVVLDTAGGAASSVGTVQFGDGLTISSSQLNSIIASVQQFITDNALVVDSVSDVYNNADLMNIIAAAA
jgi:Ca2+-binding RTX toxin-like protein